MRIRDWGSNVCSSDRTLTGPGGVNEVRNMRNGESQQIAAAAFELLPGTYTITVDGNGSATGAYAFRFIDLGSAPVLGRNVAVTGRTSGSADNQTWRIRSEEHTSELQSLMRTSYAVFCLTKTHRDDNKTTQHRP